ncbi:NEW3 domain-containing protein [Roseiflexus sp.]|uniref:NEW3 domain-containing protein n=1 Tax=Roseiflexus sp. TaxID=2562120 RepID=UPI0021DEAE61|nr:NEW3 domain-containing protein [Roseiflexus sp.]GIW03226.1 MAG: CSLREA domain-containing protein [Roseiflexus sp.]
MTRAYRLLFVLALLAFSVVAPAPSALAATFTVNSTADDPDASPGNGVCQTAGGQCTLRAAIQEANALAGPHTIAFNIPTAAPGYDAAGFWRIRPASALPGITAGNVTIDGRTQPAGNPSWTHPRIVIDGSLITSGANGLTITSSGNTIRRLTIQNFATSASDLLGITGIGIFILDPGATNNRIHGCYLGTSPDGSSAAANRLAGVQIRNAGNNIIGNPTAGAGPDIDTAGDNALGNLISGNGQTLLTAANVYLTASSSYDDGRGNVIRGNLIGTNLAGNAKIGSDPGNQRYGVLLYQYLDDTIIDANVISGHDAAPNPYGIYVFGDSAASSPTDTVISGNVIGTTKGGTSTTRVPNGVGIYIGSASNTLIGGATPAARNIIAGNGVTSPNGHGVQLSSSRVSGTTIQGNYIGLNANGASFGRSGTDSLGNLGHGIFVETNARQTTIRDNVISNNFGNGIRLSSDGSVVVGNRIGVNTASPPVSDNTFANGQASIWISRGTTSSASPGNRIGGTNPGDANVIAYGLGSTPVAVQIRSDGTPNTSNNEVIGNFIGVAPTGDALRSSPSSSSIGVYVVGASSLRADNNRIIGNTIGGLGTGIQIESSFTTGNEVSANTIGLAGAGNRYGVWLFQTSGHTIGGAGGVGVNTTRNIIANNTLHGVLVGVNSNGNTLLRNLARNNGGASGGHGVMVDSTVSQVRISGTETSENNGKGINRAGSPPQPPTIVGITGGSPPTLQVQVPAGANCGASGCRVEVFTSPTRDDAEGPRYLAFLDGAAAGATVNVPVPDCDRFFSATVTDQTNNTSEFTPTMFEAPFSCQTDFILAQTGRTPPGSGPVNPGTIVTYTYTVTNTGASPIVVTISRTDSTGWASTPSPATLNLNAGASGTFTISVAVPSNALAGNYTFSVTAQVGATQRTVNTTTTVAQVYGVAIAPTSQTATFARPQVITFTHAITNTGNGPDTIVVTAAVSPNDGATVSVIGGDCVSLAAFSSCARQVQLTIPAGPGASLYTVTVTVSSSGNPAIQAMATDTASAGAVPQIAPASQLKEGLPGETVTFTHTVTNIGQSAGTFTPSLTLSQGSPWSGSLTDPSSFTLNPNDSRVVTLTVTVPNAPIPDAGTLVTATLTVQASGGASAAAASITRVGLVPGFTLSAATVPTLNLPPGATAVFTHTLTNTGNGLDTFVVTATLSSGLENLTVTPSGPFSLARGASQQVVVQARVRDGQAVGTEQIQVTGARVGGGVPSQTQTDTVNVQAAPGVRLSPGQTQNITPPGSVTFTHVLTNVGNVAGDFSVSVSGLPAGWSVAGPTNLVPANCLMGLTSGATCRFDLTVTTPSQLPQVPAGVYPFQVQVSTTSASDAVTDTVNVLAVPQFAFTADESGSGAPDTVITFTHRLTNTGNVTDTYTFSIAVSGGGFSADPPATVAAVPPGEGQLVPFAVRIPPAAPAGTTGVITLTATSAQGAPSQSVSDMVTVNEADNARLEVVGPAQQTVFTSGAPAVAIYTLNLFNTGNTTISYTLRLNPASLTSGWTAGVAPTLTAVLPPSATAPTPLTVQVSVPADVVGTQAVTVEALRGDGAGPVLAAETLTTTAQLIATGDLLTPPENQGFGLPGETVVYTHTLRNVRSVADTFVFSALVPLGYEVTLPPATFLSPGEEREVSVSIRIPGGVFSNTVDAMRLSVQSVSDPNVAADAREYTTIRQVVSAVMSPEYVRVVQAGDQVQLTHQLLNTGNTTDTFVLTFTQTLPWNVVLQPSLRTLGPNQQAPFITLDVSVPANAPPGSVNRIRVRAQSQSDPTKVFEVENLFVIPVALPQVTYEVYLPLVKR